MKIKLPLEISLTNFKDRLREKPKREGNVHFSGENLAILGKDYWGDDKMLDFRFIKPTWKFPKSGSEEYYATEEVYKRLVKLKRITPPPTSPYAR
jgi:hypothetical protein